MNNIPSRLDVFEWGGSSRELDINLRDRASIIATELRLAEMESSDSNEIDWFARPESAGRFSGRVYDESGNKEVGIVVFDKAAAVGRVMSFEVLRTELGARARHLYAATFAGGIATGDIKWRLLGGVSCEDPSSLAESEYKTGFGIASVDTTGTPMYMLAKVAERSGKVGPIIPTSKWLLYTSAEVEAFFAGVKEGEFNTEDQKFIDKEEPLLPSIPRPMVDLLDFEASLIEREGVLTYTIDESMAARWATRSQSSLAYYSQYTDFLVNSFARNRSAVAAG